MHHIGAELGVECTFIILLVAASIYDLRYRILPNKLLVIALFSGVLLKLGSDKLIDSLLGVAFGFLVMYVIYRIGRGALGAGDVKFYSVCCFFLTWNKVFNALLIISIVGAVVALVLQMMGKAKRGHPIPYGPIIALGSMFVYYF